MSWQSTIPYQNIIQLLETTCWHDFNCFKMMHFKLTAQTLNDSFELNAVPFL
jgi:hypothetical protein